MKMQIANVSLDSKLILKTSKPRFEGKKMDWRLFSRLCIYYPAIVAQSTPAVTSKWQLRPTRPVNIKLSAGENGFSAKNRSWPGRLWINPKSSNRWNDQHFGAVAGVYSEFLIDGPKYPFGVPRGPWAAPVLGTTVFGWLPHTLTWYQVYLLLARASKGPFLS